MRQFKPILLFLIVLLSGFSLETERLHSARWVITKGSSLKVGGNTNINTFICIIANYSRPDTLTFNKNKSAQSVKASGALKLSIQEFDCHNRVMTADLRKALKAKEYPNLIIRFLSLSRYPDLNGSQTVKGMVTIELAGTAKQFEVDYKVIPGEENSLKLIGTRAVRFSDFNITPPRKMGGMVQAKNDLNVEFNLNLRVLN